MGKLTDAQLQVFQLMVEAIKAGQGTLFQVDVEGISRAAIASYARVGGKGRLGVYGFLLTSEEAEAVGNMLQKQEYVAPPQESMGHPDITPVPLPADDQLDNFLSTAHEGYTLREMCVKHMKRIDISSQGRSNSDESTDFEEFVNRGDGQVYLAVTMMQLFRQDPGRVYGMNNCLFCGGEVGGPEDGWRRCCACGCAWSEDGGFRKGTQEGGVQ